MHAGRGQILFAIAASGFLQVACGDNTNRGSSRLTGDASTDLDVSVGSGGARPIPTNPTGGAGQDASVDSATGGSGGFGGSGSSTGGALPEAGPGGRINAGGTAGVAGDASVSSGGADGGRDASEDGPAPRGCVVEFSTGFDQACARRTDGTLWCWGSNQYGQLGDGTSAIRNGPVFVSALGKSAVHVSAGEVSTCAWAEDGAVWCWGVSDYIGNDGQRLFCGSSSCDPTPVRMQGFTEPVVQVATGAGPCAVQSDGTLWCWGYAPPAEQSAFGTNIAEVRVGNLFKCARKTDGSLWCSGYNDVGQLGDGTTSATFRNAPTQVTAFGTNVAGFTAGDSYACARKTDGTLWCWGSFLSLADVRDAGAGQPTPTQMTTLGSSVIAVSSGRSHTCAVKADGTLWCWGKNQFGQLGDGTTVERDAPVQVKALGQSVTDVSAGGGSTCAKKSDGTLWCWGKNDYGQLGNGTASAATCIGRAIDSAGNFYDTQVPCETSPVAVVALCDAVADMPGPVVVGDGGCSTATAAWPASIDTSETTCVPNCDAPTCASTCQVVQTGTDSSGRLYAIPTETGMPCDTGCCPTNEATWAAISAGCCSSGYATIAADPSGHVHYAGTAGLGYHGTFREWESADGVSWFGGSGPDFAQTDPTFSDNPIRVAVDPHFAFGGSGGSAAEYAAYALGLPWGYSPGFPPVPPPPMAPGRLGVTVAGKQTWEDMPAYGKLAADASGAALLLTGDKIFRRTGLRTWESICLPGSEGPGVAITVDSMGAWYIARNGSDGLVRVSRRDPNGGWATETVGSGSAWAIAVGVGAVHVAFRKGADVHYARRVGTNWVEHVAMTALNIPPLIPNDGITIANVYLTIDECGAPHLGVFGESPAPYMFDAYYTRWTPTGWVRAHFTNTRNSQLTGGIALTPSHAVLAIFDGDLAFVAIPRK